MSTYKVLKDPSEKIEVIKMGFSWMAIPFVTFLPFFPIWFLFRGLWRFFIAYILLILILASIDFEIYGELGFFNFSTANNLQILIVIAEVVILLLPAFKVNDWTVENLKNKGYEVVYTLQASSKKEALELAHSKKKINYDKNY